jgi:predicted NACHT family NTPase
VGFSAYLQSLIANYEKQRDLYTLTDLQVEYREEKERSPDGSERQPEKGSERQPEKKVERLEVLTGLRKYVQKGQVLLVGKPGSGKSTALDRLRWELAQAALADEQQPIPMLVALRGLRHNFGILETIAFELQKGDPNLVLEFKDIQQLLLKGRLFLLLDGVNEVPSDDLYSDVELFRGNLSNAPMIFTSRELGVRLGVEQKLEMCGLTERQMRSFVQNYLPDYAEVLLRQLKDRVRELAETPLLLKLLCDVFDPVTQQLSQSKGELFRAMDAKFNNWKQQEGVRTAEKFWQWNSDILRYLAFVMLQADDTPTGKWLQIERTHSEHLLEEFLQDRVTAPGEKARDW